VPGRRSMFTKRPSRNKTPEEASWRYRDACRINLFYHDDPNQSNLREISGIPTFTALLRQY